MGTALVRARTLRGLSVFRKVFKYGRRRQDAHCSLLVVEDNPGGVAICLRRGPNAVTRNRMRRITREALEPWMPDLKAGYAVVIFPALALRQMSLDQRRQVMQSALQRAGMLL